MDIKVSTVHGEVTPDMKDYADKKLRKVSKFLSRGNHRADVQLSVSEPWCQAETVLAVKNHNPLVAKSRSDDMYKAIDQMVEKLERQVRDLKEKRSKERKRASQRVKAVRMEEAIEENFTEDGPESQ